LSGSYSGSLLGMRHATWEAAVGRERAMEIEMQAARLALSAEVTRTYVRLAHAYRAHDLASQDAARAQSLLELTLQRVKAGIDSTAQQRLAEASVASARKRLEQAAHAIDGERIALAVLVGKGPDRAGDIARPAALRPLVVSVPDDLPANLLGRRPDIVAARWRVEAAGKDIEASQAAFYPSFNLNAGIGLVSFDTDQLLSLRSRYFFIAPALSLPIFDAGRVRAGLAGSNAGFDIAVAEYNKTLVGAINDVVLQIRSAHSLDQQAAEQQQAVNAARDGWEMALQRYRSGIASQIETLTMQQSVLTAEGAMTDVEEQQLEAAIRLVQALGGGYLPATIDIPADSTKKDQNSRTPS
jgi:NodT family efflux transporter outer membrane factor (OMF) lipoprotein